MQAPLRQVETNSLRVQLSFDLVCQIWNQNANQGLVLSIALYHIKS